MTIAETSKQYGLSVDTLRYYERIGLIPAVKRTQGGIRDYDEESCRWVNFAKCMRGAGVEIEALVTYVALFQQGESTEAARKQILIEQREKLHVKITSMKKMFELLDYKIAHYEKIISNSSNLL